MGPAGGGQSQDDALSALWMAVFAVVVLFVIWYFFRTQLLTAGFWVKAQEVKLLSFFNPNLASARDSLLAVKPSVATFPMFASVCTWVGQFFRLPFSVFILGLAIAIYYSNPVSRYRQTYSMDTLLEAERDNWPYIAPVVGLNLVDQDLDQQPWAMSEQPLTFARRNKIVFLEQVVSDDELKTKVRSKLRVFEDEAMKIFALQLGDFYRGPQFLPPHMQALFGIFASRANHDISSATAALEWIAKSFGAGKVDFSPGLKLMNKYKDTRVVREVEARHAYTLTFMASMLILARADGVIATAEFLWLKPMDRKLWYMLNNVGRQTAFPEVAGIFSHWMVERELKRKLVVPVVKEAVTALDLALGDILYKPEASQE